MSASHSLCMMSSLLICLLQVCTYPCLVPACAHLLLVQAQECPRLLQLPPWHARHPKIRYPIPTMKRDSAVL